MGAPIAQMINLQGMLFIFIFVGMLAGKKKLVTAEGRRCLTNLTLYVVLPCNIASAFIMPFSYEMLMNFLWILLIAIGVQVFCLILSHILFNRLDENLKPVFQYATVCSNSSFMGYPVAESIYGAAGLSYTAIYLIPLRIVMWSAGLSFFTKTKNRKAMLLKVALHPCMIAVYVGLILLFFQPPLPQLVTDTLDKLGGCTTALSMMLVGMLLTDVKWKTMISVRALLFSALRLIVIPGAVFLFCKGFHIDPLITGVSVILAGMPAGTTTALLAAQYGGDAQQASKLVVLTTLLSLFTITGWYFILS
ncbi:AEC family transporter [bacterium 210820-DFI.6.37]|nr:AEC family transporter [bacterium 210820-DFI.6.37]